jgi:hypothetical protein
VTDLEWHEAAGRTRSRTLESRCTKHYLVEGPAQPRSCGFLFFTCRVNASAPSCLKPAAACLNSSVSYQNRGGGAAAYEAQERAACDPGRLASNHLGSLNAQVQVSGSHLQRPPFSCVRYADATNLTVYHLTFFWSSRCSTPRTSWLASVFKRKIRRLTEPGIVRSRHRNPA